VSNFWKRLCTLTKTTRYLSTAYHPETDGATERANQELEIFIRAYTSHAQDDWEELLPIAELALNNKNSATTGVSPFFLTHGYDIPIVETIAHTSEDLDNGSPIARAEAVVAKLREAKEWAQMAMALAQQDQARHADRHRAPAPRFEVGDSVWLNLKNIRTTRASKKLDWKNRKFTITEVIGSHAYRLDTPPGIHNVFHTNLLRLAHKDPWPSQVNEEREPPPVVTDEGDEEYEVEEVIRARTKKVRGKPQRQVQVKWRGYLTPTWEPLDALQSTAALAQYESTYGPADTANGPGPPGRGRRGVLSRAEGPVELRAPSHQGHEPQARPLRRRQNPSNSRRQPQRRRSHLQPRT
jgi:hypothetical protein